MSAGTLAPDGRQAAETVDDEPMRVIEALMANGGMFRSLRIARAIDAGSSGILQALLGGTCPQLARLELDIDLLQHPDHLIALLHAVLVNLPTLREVVLLIDPLPPPIQLLAAALASGIDRITIGSRTAGMWHVEAAEVGNLLRSMGAGLSLDRTLILVHPLQARFDSGGRLQYLEDWPDAVRRTVKVTAMQSQLRLFFSNGDPLSPSKQARSRADRAELI